MNKKLVIAIFFSILMIAGSIVLLSGNSGVQSALIQNEASSSAGLNNITYGDYGNISAAGVYSNITITNNGVDAGYVHIYRYDGYDNSVYFSTTTFVNETGDAVDFSNLSSSSADFDYGAFYGPSGGLSTWDNYGLSGINSPGSHSLRALVYDSTGNITYVIFSSPNNGVFRFNLTAPVYVSKSMPYRLYSDEQILDNSVCGGDTDIDYNPYYNLIYMPSQFNNSLYILNGSNYSFEATITTNMTNAFSAIYNPYNHFEYVSSFSDGLSIFNGTKIIASGLNATFGPIGLVYDPANHDVYATSNNDDGMAVYHNTTYVASIPYSSDAATGSPFSAIYDKFNGMIYSTYINSSSDFGIVEINPVVNSIVKFIPTKYLLDSLVMDNANKEIYATSAAYTQYYTDYGTAAVSVYSGNFTFSGKLSNVKMEMGMAVINKDLYIEGNDSSLFVYSPGNSLVYRYSHLNPENDLMGITLDNSTGKLILSSMSQSGNNYPPYKTKLIAIMPFDSLAVREIGLPAGTIWSYTLNNVSYNVNGSTYNASLFNGKYSISTSSNGYMYPVYQPVVYLNGTATEIIHFELKGLKISENRMVIGYWLNNSLSAGNFTFHNYPFHEQILSPTAIFISTNSTSASNITLSFKVAPGLYNVEMKNGNRTTLINQTAPVNGYINVTYNPGKMPLDPEFTVNQVDCEISPAPPPLPPGGPISVITHPVKYFDYSIWTILMWAGIIAIIALTGFFVVRRR